MKKFWKVSDEVSSDDNELYIDGVISDESWYGDEATPQQLREELQRFRGRPLTVVLNSVGGDVWAGLAMYNALRELDSEVTIRVDGLAASIASVIAMAGDNIIMSPGSMMMVHRPSTIAWGNVEEMEKTIALLKTIEESIFPIYADRTGLSIETVTELVNAETWMSAEKAVELGFADSLAKSVKKAEEAPTNSIQAGNFAFSMKATSEAIVQAVANMEAEPEAEEPTPAPEEPTPAEPETPEQPEEPEAAPAAEEQLEEEPSEEEVTEPTPDEPTNAVEEETPTMSKVETPEGIVAKAPEAPATPSVPSAEQYLKSRKSIEDFANILVEQAGQSAQDVKDAWGQHLVKMGITNPDILLPSALITEIEDAFKEGGEIWNLVNKTGLTVFRAAWDTVTGENSRAKGYNRDEEENKAEEVITLADRVIRPQFIYKYITLNKEDIKENRDTGALVRYVLSELPRRIIREVERAIIIGDGRAPGSDYKIDSFLSVLDDAEGAGNVATVYTPGVGETKYETLLRVRARLKAEGAKYLVAKTEYLIEVLLEQNANGGFLWAPGTDVARAMGFAGSIEPDWLDDTSSPDYDAFGVVFGQYRTVGDNTIEAFTNFVLKTNKQEYLQEIYAGGALTALNSGVAVAKPAAS